MNKIYVLELERGDTKSGLFLDPSGTLVPAPDKAETFVFWDIAHQHAKGHTDARDKIGERFVVSEIQQVSGAGWRRVA